MPPFATPCPKLVRRPSLAALALPLALLAGCSQDGPPPLPPLPEGALEAVVTDPGVPREQLGRAVDDLFTAEGIGTTYAVVVLHKGEVVAERYGEGMSEETRFVGWSMSKTVTAVLIGMLVADGRLELDEAAPVPSWQRAGDPRGEITLRELLQMRSGLRHREGYDPPYESSEVQMLYLKGHDDMAAFAEAQALETVPGEEFRYSTATSVILADIATDLIAPDGSPVQRQQAMASFLDARLAAPVGMESMVGEYDAAGTLVGGSSIWATARDWGKFGEFLRHGGSVKGAQIVPRRWIEFMRAPSPASPDYGAQLWLNRPSEGERNELFAARGPDTAFAAVGHLGQYVIVSPDQSLTVVRLGKTDGPERHALVEQLADIVQLYPGR